MTHLHRWQINEPDPVLNDDYKLNEQLIPGSSVNGGDPRGNQATILETTQQSQPSNKADKSIFIASKSMTYPPSTKDTNNTSQDW
jgi:hypothetical protein